MCETSTGQETPRDEDDFKAMTIYSLSCESEIWVEKNQMLLGLKLKQLKLNLRNVEE